jgi:polar amino acid transport system substrate-binding protein
MQKVFQIIIFITLILITNSAPAQNTRYVVKEGDTLSQIAKNVYNDPSKWPHIYRANKALIKNAGQLNVGWNLLIPSLDVMPSEKSQADSSDAQKSEDDSIIRLVTGNSYSPFTDQSLPNDGMITEIVVKTFKEMGERTEIEFWSWDYGFNATLEGEFVATFPYLKNEERMKKWYYSEPLFNILILCFVKKNSSIKYDAPEDFQGLTFCRPEGYYMHDLQSLLDNGIISIKRPKKIETCFHLLKQGEVDAVPVNEFVGKEVVKREFGSAEYFDTLEKAISEDTLHLILPKDNPENLHLLHKFDQVVKKMKKDGTLQKIIKRHLMYYQALLEE